MEKSKIKKTIYKSNKLNKGLTKLPKNIIAQYPELVEMQKYASFCMDRGILYISHESKVTETLLELKHYEI